MLSKLITSLMGWYGMWQVKVGIIGAAALGFWFWQAHLKTVAYDQGVKAGIQKGLSEALQNQQEQWKAKEAQLQLRETEIEAKAAELEQARNSLLTIRYQINKDANSQLTAITSALQHEKDSVVLVPVSELPALLDEVLKQLREAK